MTTKAVIFDLWNTLAYNKDSKANPIVKLQEMLGLNLNIYREVEQGFMMNEFKTKRDAMISLCKHLGLKPKQLLVDSLVHMWDNMQLNVTLFPDVAPILEKLKVKYKIALLSNTECFSIKEFKEKGFGKYFDYTAFSCEIGLLKPDPKVFRLVLDKLGVKGDEAVMVGDNYQDDVLAAEKVGMRAILLKRDYAKYKAKPSHIESHNHTSAIEDLSELEALL